MKKIIKSYFNIWYIKFFYLLQKDIKLNKNIRNINVLIDKFINVYDNSNIACNKKNNKKNYIICIIILFLINLFMVIVLYLLFINKVKFITNTHHNKAQCKACRSLVVLRSKELVFFVYY